MTIHDNIILSQIYINNHRGDFMNPITNFEIYKFYERETKITTEDIALICTHAMELLEKEGLEKTSSQESISFLKTIIDITLEKHTYNFNNDDYRK